MTVTKENTVQSTLSSANPNNLADAARHGNLGLALSPVKVTFAALTSATSHDITTAASRAAATIVGISPALAASQLLPAAGSIDTLRVTAGAAAAGHRNVTDVGGTPAATLATISDDGKTITFEAGVTAFVLTYFPRVENLLGSYSFGSP